MLVIRRRLWNARVAGLLAVCFLAGCKTVDPKPDYARARERIAQATGQTDCYLPGDDAAIEARVQELLAGGLTVDTTVRIALLNNRDLQGAWMNVGMAKADLVQSGLMSNPSIDFAMRFPASTGIPDLTADLAQNIADLWRIPVRKRGARHDLDQAILELADKGAALAAQAKQAYYDLAGAEMALEIAEQNLAIAQRLLNFALIRQQAGAGAEIDVNLARGPVLEAELAVKTSRLTADARLALAKLLSLTIDAEKLVIRDRLPDPPADFQDVDQLIELARGHRLDLQAADQEVASAEAKWQLEKLNVIPAIQLGAQMERNQQRAQPRRHLLADTARSSIAAGALTAPSIQPRSERHQIRSSERNLSIITGPSIGADLPIFDQNQAQIAKAFYAYQQAAKSYEAVDRSLAHDVRGALERTRTAWEIVHFYREQSLPLANRNLELSTETYRAGKSSLLEVLEAQRFLLDTRSKYVDALHDAAAKLSDLERVIGLPAAQLVTGPLPATRPATAPATAPGG